MGAKMCVVEAHRDAIHEIASRHRAVSVSVFGSVARGDDGPGSDIDFLVDFHPGATLLDLMHLEDDLQAAEERPLHDESVDHRDDLGPAVGLRWRCAARITSARVVSAGSLAPNWSTMRHVARALG